MGPATAISGTNVPRYLSYAFNRRDREIRTSEVLCLEISEGLSEIQKTKCSKIQGFVNICKYSNNSYIRRNRKFESSRILGVKYLEIRSDKSLRESQKFANVQVDPSREKGHTRGLKIQRSKRLAIFKESKKKKKLNRAKNRRSIKKFP